MPKTAFLCLIKSNTFCPLIVTFIFVESPQDRLVPVSSYNIPAFPSCSPIKKAKVVCPDDFFISEKLSLFTFSLKIQTWSI